jgi:hypothetical protein
MRLKPTHTISTVHFHYDIKRKEFTSEASSLGSLFIMDRLFDDSCDMGIHLISKLTGTVETFFLACEHRDSDGDITHWTFCGLGRNIRDLVVTIFND